MKQVWILVFLFSFVILSCNNKKKEAQVADNDTETIEAPIHVYDTFSYKGFNEIANYIGGTQPEEEAIYFSKYFSAPDWKNYANANSESWNLHSQQVLDIVSDWSEKNLTYGDTVFYPFGGPDFNYLDAMFPKAKHFVMMGLENVGDIPDLEDIEKYGTKSHLSNIQQAIQHNLNLSFFQTNSMKVVLNSDIINGTIPIIMYFLNRHDKVIVNINPASINEQGDISVENPDEEFAYNYKKKFNNGVEFVYREKDTKELKKLTYLSLDICDIMFTKPHELQFITNYTKNNTVYLKAASYLCFRDTFSKIRNIILDNASQVVTDPSGIPYKYLKSKFDVKLYGEYNGPIKLFAERNQPDLKQAIDSIKPGRLPFKYGYHPTHWCIMVATKR
ncbi:MAG: hypothetical protein QM212_05505 [Bacteroidota bacterium]|jgi:hypothetical protein|nr:hypothetical protein [Bacteroidota bacterium]NLP20365.1 hypothetical protein [Bacteroidales bacterium]HOE39264.1 hypothetical protein [Bacteroidales bacterium]HPL04303.1 hypothetical protein [Bacteroidales bacterium]